MKKYFAELIGTFALVLIGAGAVCFEKISGTPDPIALPMIALAHGLTLAAMIYALGHISGVHINPAVTIAMRLSGKIGNRDAVGYVIAQLIGAALAGYMLRQLFDAVYLSGHLGSTDLRASFPPMKGLLCEVVGTFLFFMVIFGAAIDGRTAGKAVGFAIGLSLASLIMLFGPFTGASFNPARSFGPALASGHWNNFWIYVIGPVIGGSFAGFLQTKFFMKP